MKVENEVKSNEDTVADVERRDALTTIAKFTAYTGPGIAMMLATEQAMASGFKKPTGDSKSSKSGGSSGGKSSGGSGKG